MCTDVVHGKRIQQRRRVGKLHAHGPVLAEKVPGCTHRRWGIDSQRRQGCSVQHPVVRKSGIYTGPVLVCRVVGVLAGWGIGV